jgi:hypothetical protein
MTDDQIELEILRILTSISNKGAQAKALLIKKIRETKD